jgi:O-antigen/teichoic acid export membrane protein
LFEQSGGQAVLLRHSGYYLIARGLPGLINFIALSVYTHLLLPGDYGQYALALATATLLNAVLFQWLHLGLLRFMSRYAGCEERLTSTVMLTYVLIVGATGVVGAVTWMALQPGPWREILPAAVCFFWVQGWLEINLQLLVSRLKPLQYGIVAGTRSVLGLSIGVMLVWAGWRADAPLWGLVVGGMFAVAWVARTEWRGARLDRAEFGVLRELLFYGLPLSATVILNFVVSTSDRYLLAWFIDERAAGQYSAGYDLAQLSLIVVMMVVNMAAYPIALRALEQEGVEAAQMQLQRQGLLLLAVAGPLTAGFVVLAENIVTVVLGAEFHSSAREILPWIAAAALIGGLKSYYYDLAFQLGKHTVGQIQVAAVASLINVVLNLLWIPRHGLLGAAWATLAALAAGLTISERLGRRVFRLPGLSQHVVKVGAAVLFMAAVVWPWRELSGVTALCGQILLGGGAYAVALIVLNPGNIRRVITRRMTNLWTAV